MPRSVPERTLADLIDGRRFAQEVRFGKQTDNPGGRFGFVPLAQKWTNPLQAAEIRATSINCGADLNPQSPIPDAPEQLAHMFRLARGVDERDLPYLKDMIDSFLKRKAERDRGA